MLQSIEQSVSNFGIRKSTSTDEAKRLRTINRLAFLISFLSGFYALLMLALGLMPQFGVASAVVPFGLIAPFLIKTGHPRLAKSVFIAQFYILFTGLTWVFGRNSNAEFTCLYMPALALLLFRRINFWAHIGISLLVFGLCKIIVHTTEALIVPHYPMLWEGFMAIVHCVGFFSVVYLLRAEATASEALIFEKNRRLHDAFSEQKKTEERLLIANQELQQFASLASHDMKEPLRTISSFSQLLARRVPDDKPSQEFLAFIKDAAQRMAVLLDDLISFARAGSAPQEAAPISLGAALEKVENNLFLLISQKNATISTTSELPVLLGHETLFVQLFQNLIANGIKFQKAGSAPAIQIFAEKRPDHLVLAVRDNGIGIEPEFQEQIFSPFRRLHSRTEFDGSGIGLATCKKIVEHYEGCIEVESTVGEGSIFRLVFPKNLAAEGVAGFA